jgi:hypothetical protein
MNILSNYILVGLVFSIYFEVCGWYILKYSTDPIAIKAGKAWEALKIYERLLIFMFWPVSVVVWLIAVVRASVK